MTPADRDRAVAILTAVAARIKETKAEFEGNCGWGGHIEANLCQLGVVRKMIEDERAAPAAAEGAAADRARRREILAVQIIDQLNMYLPDAVNHRSSARAIVIATLEAADATGI